MVFSVGATMRRRRIVTRWDLARNWVQQRVGETWLSCPTMKINQWDLFVAKICFWYWYDQICILVSVEEQLHKFVFFLGTVSRKKLWFFWILSKWGGLLGKRSIEKKRFLSGIARMRGGGLPMPEFFGPLSRSAFLVNKKSLFLQKGQCIEL